MLCRGSLVAVVGACLVCSSAPAHVGGVPPVNGPTLPANDLENALALTGGQVVEPPGSVMKLAEPPVRAAPRARCSAGSTPLEGIQGRVSAADLASPAAAQGWTCNVSRVGFAPTPGGFRVWRYVDRNRHVCAFYDTSITSPASAVSTALGPSEGVVVLDMSDPSRPRRTATLQTAAMLAPHESLNLNSRRGLLAAGTGNGTTLPGSIAVYDVSSDCRRPVLQSEMPIPYGHESGFSPDGRTFWVAGGAGEVQAVDLVNPKAPNVVWRGAMYSHGLGVSADGRTLFQTDPINGNLGILDVSEVQDRKPSPKVRQISRVTWDPVSIPQNAIPIELGGREHVLEFDEFAFRFNPATIDDKAGGARIIDVSTPSRPRVVSHLRLEVNQRDVHQKVPDDPNPFPSGQAFGYSAHYCAVPREVDPDIVACSFVNSGLRVFDIRDPASPREVAYFIAPNPPSPDGSRQPNFAMSQPAFDPARREVWYTDSFSGFYALKLTESAWPDPTPRPAARRRCTSRRLFTIRLPRSLRSARVTYAGRSARPRRRAGRLVARINLRGLAPRTVAVRITGRTRTGRLVRARRTYRTCRPRSA